MEAKHGRSEEPPACGLCGSPAVYLDRAGHRHLCADHLVQDIGERVRRAIREYRLIRPGDRLMVALSGGKDSTALLHLLSGIVPGPGGVTLEAVTIDEGIAGYREATMSVAREMAASLGVRHRTVSFEEVAGSTLDAMVAAGAGRPCSLCGVHRRRALLGAAEEAGATAVATGHNLDDEAQTVVMNAFRGDLPRFTRPPVRDAAEGGIRRIKPLFRIPEKEVALYGMLTGIFRELPECPYAGTAMRSEVRRIVDRAELLCPGAMERIVRGQEEVAAVWRAGGGTGPLAGGEKRDQEREL
ncbi:MAG TPA: tRNA 2-thiocytidine biosynthesis TtcA family protein [Methanomicrobiales archaeon]|nr:tRNA 2-thiocytidine biosynthesis TtcA family protein [Methanomicrobiales archaeon]